tara:strand:+ start:19650 stop:19970 length:321 start_codon:yes stop_codon:yes gene_type:complete
MNNSNKLQTKLETDTQTYNNILKSSLALAFERTNLPAFNIDNLVNDISNKYKNLPNEIMLTAIKKGALGEFGRTYRMSTQEVCIWINEHLKSINRDINGKPKINMV